jgi:hypothetical protein
MAKHSSIILAIRSIDLCQENGTSSVFNWYKFIEKNSNSYLKPKIKLQDQYVRQTLADWDKLKAKDGAKPTFDGLHGVLYPPS